jgi:hypothetical protein
MRMKQSGDVEIKTREHIGPRGIRENKYTVILQSDVFCIDSEPCRSRVEVVLDERRLEELLREVWGAMQADRFDTIVKDCRAKGF